MSFKTAAHLHDQCGLCKHRQRHRRQNEQRPAVAVAARLTLHPLDWLAQRHLWKVREARCWALWSQSGGTM